MRVYILEDETPASNRLVRMLKEYDHETEIIGIAESVEEASKQIKLLKSPPDLLLLDIEVADGSGFELLKLLNHRIPVIFTTAYDIYAVKAFREKALDYLMKPIKFTELAEGLDQVKSQLQNKKSKNVRKVLSKERFSFKFGSKFYSIRKEQIAYVYSENKVSYFVTWDGEKTPSDYWLRDLELELDPSLFYRANRQLIVHIDSISEMKVFSNARIKLSLNPVFKSAIIISTQKATSFKEWLNR